MKCCKECPNDKCILCNGDDIKYPELTLEEALKKVQEEELAPLSFATNIYYSNLYPIILGLVVDGRYQVNGKKHLVFNSYKRKMIILDGLRHISSLESGLVILTGEKTGTDPPHSLTIKRITADKSRGATCSHVSGHTKAHEAFLMPV